MAEVSELVVVKNLTVARSDISRTVSALRKQCQDSVGNGSTLSKVRTEDEGLIWNSTHEVTGAELNNLITQIQGALSNSAAQRRALWNSLIEVYGTLDKLDAEYLCQIDKSFELINKNYEKIKANNKDINRSQAEIENHSKKIDELINGHEIALQVLKKFKAKIDKLSHLEEIDKLLSRINVEESLNQLGEEIAKIRKAEVTHDLAVSELKKFKAKIDKLSHLEEVDKLLGRIDIEKSLNDVNEKLQVVCTSVKAHNDDVAEIKSELRGVGSHISEAFHKALVAIELRDKRINAVEFELLIYKNKMKKWMLAMASALIVSTVIALMVP